jgi:large subunit ribosomal protein L41e
VGVLDSDFSNIKKTTCHHTLKCVVFYRRSFLGCSRNNYNLKVVVFVKFLDINIYKCNFYKNSMKRSSRRWKKKRQMRWKWQRKRLKKEKKKRKLHRQRSK